jgi:endonuclease YncB( thermonuclease family)
MPWHHCRMNPRASLLSFALLASFQTPAATLTGKVVEVADGDTITILVGTEQQRIRLQGIDAPERKQPFGKASGRALPALVAGKQVRVEYDKRDRYGRIVGVVWVRSRRGTGGGVSGSYVPAPTDNQECGSAQAP